MIVQSSGPVDPAAARPRAPLHRDRGRRRSNFAVPSWSTPERIAIVTNLLASLGLSMVSLRTRASLEERYLELIGEQRSESAAVNAWLAQTRAEVTMTLRRGETLLLTVGIPVLLLLFFSLTHVTTTPRTHRVDFVAPGVLALCVLSTSLVALSIATGFERSSGVLRRLHVTPLGQGRLIGAKIGGVLVTEAHPGRGRSWRSPSRSRGGRAAAARARPR